MITVRIYTQPDTHDRRRRAMVVEILYDKATRRERKLIRPLQRAMDVVMQQVELR